MRKLLPLLLLILISCNKDEHVDKSLDEGATIESLKKDISFVIGKWELSYFEPTYNSSSWIIFNEDCTYKAYFVFPKNPYTIEPAGTYSYNDGVISCVDEDGGKRTLEFITITGRTSANKIRHTYIDGDGNTQTLFYDWCKKL